MARSQDADLLAEALTGRLRAEQAEEVGWLEDDAEESRPTVIHPLERVEVLIHLLARRAALLGHGRPGRQQVAGAIEGTPLMPNDGHSNRGEQRRDRFT